MRLLIERLWQQQFEPHKLYETLAPKSTNYETFCYNVTNVIIRGIEGGWARLELPPDPMVDDPIYRLQILDQGQFGAEMELNMGDVDWNEAIDVEVAEPVAPEPVVAEAPPAPKKSKSKAKAKK